jgi:hypothetical protein
MPVVLVGISTVASYDRVIEAVSEFQFAPDCVRQDRNDALTPAEKEVLFAFGAEKPDQEGTEGCKRLIKNAIACWNYL